MLVGKGGGTDERVVQVLEGYSHPCTSGVTTFTQIGIEDLPESTIFRCADCFFIPADSCARCVSKLFQSQTYRSGISSLCMPWEAVRIDKGHAAS
jgi:hypothetical protein